MENRPTFHWVLLSLVLTALSSSCVSGNHVDNPYTTDEGSGSDDEDLSELFDVIKHDVIVRCYVCPGVSHGSGCNITLLRQNPEMYFQDCNGHCINLTTGLNTIFDCTEKVSAKKSLCFQREEMKMCVCGTDYCNGPPYTPTDIMELPESQQGISLRSEHDVNIVLPRTLRQSQSNGSSVVPAALNSEGSCVVLCSCVFYLVKFWWFCSVLRDYVL